jgi:hypothetical protein
MGPKLLRKTRLRSILSQPSDFSAEPVKRSYVSHGRPHERVIPPGANLRSSQPFGLHLSPDR